MPGYRKRVYKKKRTFKKKGGVAKKALRKVNALAKKLKPEVKFIDFVSAPEDYGQLGTVYDVTKLIPKGITENGRIGREIRLLRLTGVMQLELDTTINSSAFRFMLVKGNTEDGKAIKIPKTTATSNEIPLLDDVDKWPLISRKVDDDSKRTRIIYDKTYTLDTGSRRMITTKINFKLGWPVQYSREGDTNIVQNGGLYVAGMMNAGSEMTSIYNFRLWYTDV